MIMTTKQVAEMMDGNEYIYEFEGMDEEVLKENGIVVVYAYSDDGIVFRGAISDTYDCFGGHTFRLNADGLLYNKCDEDYCPYFIELMKKPSIELDALWCEEEGYAWTYATDIPHETFVIMEDGYKYCRGIVFCMADVVKLLNRKRGEQEVSYSKC